MTTARKSGSALLIVLGFLSFMVVSAVAFAIYMRAERMPSSALRRTVATRHLLQGALAEAIARVDDAVRGDPFPGMCPTNTDSTTDSAKTYKVNNYVADYWEGRVFMPPDPQGGTVSRETRFAPITETVSVLTLEGLGYLPPALVNDVRILSRSSWAAQWQQLPFDAGRFAYCAVNVSDYFDVNRLYANRGRTAEASGRLSLGYLFDSTFDPTKDPGTGNVGDTVNFTTDAQRFDNFVHTTLPGGDDKSGDGTTAVSGSTTPLVSMLDYNLALGKNGGSTALQPLFYKWIDGSTSPNAIYYQDETGQAKSAARQPFVTDSVSTNEKWTVDIATVKGQPFYGRDMGNENVHASDITTHNSDFFSRAFANGSSVISPMDYLTLYDYLDHDDVPISLAAPCVERVPMIAALEQTIPVTPTAMVPVAGPVEDAGGVKTTTTYFDIDRSWFNNGVLSAVVAFPFKHGGSRGSVNNFKAQAVVRCFLAPSGLKFRGDDGFAELLRPKNEDDWTKKENAMEFNGETGVFMLSARSSEIPLSVNETVHEENDAEVTGGGGSGMVAIDIDFNSLTWPGELHMLTVKKITTKATDAAGNTTTKEETKYTINFRPFLDVGGTLAPSGDLDDAAFLEVANVEFVPYMCVWVRIVNDDGTVDLVPACPKDDELNAGINSDAALETYAGSSAPLSAPLMRFEGDIKFKLGDIAAGAFTGGAVQWTPKSMYTVDPRFNWAPESWYTSTDTGINFDKWLGKVHGVIDNDDTRDDDIFLFTSNQGVLQSLGEFAFLPRLCDNGADTLGTSFNGEMKATADETLHYNVAWRSYILDRAWYAKWQALGIGRSTEKECLVNPYTDSRAVMMAALANTPVDYWAAARCMSEDCTFRKDGSLVNKDETWFDSVQNALKVAFCSKSDDSGDRVKTADLLRIADVLKASIRDETVKQLKTITDAVDPADLWMEAWDGMAWDVRDNDDDPKKFLGIDLENNVALHSVDRKFLYSYWRDCFANKQQLFLIFVRAESNALGGPGEGTPAQQGGRAVALVWRNPSATRQQGRNDDAQDSYNTNGEREPHQTRILFYHQFD